MLFKNENICYLCDWKIKQYESWDLSEKLNSQLITPHWHIKKRSKNYTYIKYLSNMLMYFRFNDKLKLQPNEIWGSPITSYLPLLDLRSEGHWPMYIFNERFCWSSPFAVARVSCIRHMLLFYAVLWGIFVYCIGYFDYLDCLSWKLIIIASVCIR